MYAVFATFIFICIMDITNLIKQKLIKELVVYCIILVISVGIGVFYFSGTDKPFLITEFTKFINLKSNGGYYE